MAVRAVRPGTLGVLVGRHLERHGTTRAHLRRLLAGRIERSVAAWGGDREALLAELDAALDRAAAAGVLDDAAWAASRARAWSRRGVAPAVALGRLAARGVAATVAEAAVGGAAEDPEWTAILAYAKRRRLGRFGDPATRADRRERDLARLGRAGFSWALARRVVDEEGWPPEEEAG